MTLFHKLKTIMERLCCLIIDLIKLKIHLFFRVLQTKLKKINNDGI